MEINTYNWETKNKLNLKINMLSVTERMYLATSRANEKEVLSCYEGASFLGSTTHKILKVSSIEREIARR